MNEYDTPPPPDGDPNDPYGSCSADMYYDGPADHERMEQQERLERERRQHRGFITVSVHAVSGAVAVELQVAGEDYLNGYELDCERWLEEDGRRSSFYGKPAGELPAAAAPPPLGYLGPQHTVREQEAPKRVASPPPHREQVRYGPLAQNPVGDAKFRKDRAAWYERTTGQKLAGTLAEQNELCDALARGFRADSTRSGRAGPSGSASGSASSSGSALLDKIRAEAAAQPCIECGRTGCGGECVLPADAEFEYVYDDY